MITKPSCSGVGDMTRIPHGFVHGGHVFVRALTSVASHPERTMLRHHSNEDGRSASFQKLCRKTKYNVYVLEALGS
jgi:hypothetical protein